MISTTIDTQLQRSASKNIVSIGDVLYVKTSSGLTRCSQLPEVKNNICRDILFSRDDTSQEMKKKNEKNWRQTGVFVPAVSRNIQQHDATVKKDMIFDKFSPAVSSTTNAITEREVSLPYKVADSMERSPNFCSSSSSLSNLSHANTTRMVGHTRTRGPPHADKNQDVLSPIGDISRWLGSMATDIFGELLSTENAFEGLQTPQQEKQQHHPSSNGASLQTPPGLTQMLPAESSMNVGFNRFGIWSSSTPPLLFGLSDMSVCA